MTTIIELQETLQNLTGQKKISFTDIGNALGTGRSNISLRAKNKSLLNDKELKRIEQYFNVDILHINQTTGIDNIVTIAYYPDVYLSAGYGVEVVDERSETVVIDSQFLMSERGLSIKPKNCKMVRISGNSMFPEYHHGDRVIIDESDKNLTDGQIYAFRYDGQCYVKEINRAGNKIKCISVNKDYEPFFIERDIDFQVFGRILPRIRL